MYVVEYIPVSIDTRSVTIRQETRKL